MSDPNSLKKEILRLTREYSKIVHASFRPGNDPERRPWTPGDNIPYAGRVFTDDEVEAAISSTLDFWLTLGSEGSAFQKELSQALGVKACLLVNSGSSANLIALSTLTSHKLPTKKRLLPGDEVITVAAGFPTTVAPIIQVGCVPVFVDADPITGNPCCDQLESAYVPGKTKAVVMAHALGNPFDLAQTLRFCRKYDLWLVEDNCDSLGSTYSMPRELAHELGFNDNSPGLDEGEDRIVRFTGAWGDISTQSFYPPHHLTMGEGGSVNIVNDIRLKSIAESFRDWGRDCWCPSGIDNSCNKRFDWQLGGLPEGYDHKYTYSHLGYNLKPLDPQAAIGRVQLRRLEAYTAARRSNWQHLRSGLDALTPCLNFSLPTHATGWNSDGSFNWDSSGCRSNPSWFGFKIGISTHRSLSRSLIVKALDQHLIGNRMLFGGNLVHQPSFVELRKDNPDAFRVACPLTGADKIMNEDLFLGTYPGLTASMLDTEIDVLITACKDVDSPSL